MDNKDKNIPASKNMLKTRHKMMYDITNRLESFSLNTVVSGFMEYNNKFIDIAKKEGGVDKESLETMVIMLAPFALLTMLAFYRVWPTVCGRLDLRSYAVYTVLLTVATSFKANLIFAFAPALLVLLIADFVRSRAKNLKNEILMGCSVFPGVALCFVQARVLFAAEDSGIRLIFTVPFDHHRMLWGPFNEAGVLGLARSFVFAAAVGLLLGRAAWKSFRYRFSLFTFAVSMAEALLLVESGERLYHANLWWGSVHLLLGILAGIGQRFPCAVPCQSTAVAAGPLRAGAGLASGKRHLLPCHAAVRRVLQCADPDL